MWGNSLECSATVGLGDDILAQAGSQFLRVTHWFDTRGVNFLHLRDQYKYAIKLLACNIHVVIGH